MMNIPPNMKMVPRELFEHVSRGHFPAFHYDRAKDVNLNQLDEFCKKYMQTLKLEDKKELLLKEREIIYEELEHPELTLARNYDEFSKLEGYNINLMDLIDTLNLSALARMERTLSKLITSSADKEKYSKAVSTDKIIGLLRMCRPDESNPNGDFLRNCIHNIMAGIDSITHAFEKTSTQIPRMTREVPGLEVTDVLDFRKLHYIFNNAKANDPKTIENITKILNSGYFDNETRQILILAAGKFKSQENFEILKKIALDSNEKSPVARQNALQSLSLYLRKNPEEVEKTLETVKNENSEFSPLATVLLDKIKGTYHGQTDRELKYNFYNYKDTASIREKLSRFIEIDAPINKQQANKIDMSAMPFANIFKEKCVTLTEDTMTKFEPDLVGKRNLYFDQYPNMGFFWDSLRCASGNTGKAMVNKDIFQRPLNTMAHELGHSLNFLFYDNPAQEELYMLYENAVKNHRCLDRYAQSHPAEYFAQGCEAYASVYKPHKELLSNHYGISDLNTRYALLERDPNLYKFIEKMIKTYSN